MRFLSAFSLILSLTALHCRAGQEFFGRLRDLYGRPESEQVGCRFNITGQIMFFCDTNPRRLTIIDRDQPRSMCFWDYNSNPPAYRSGDTVRLRGTICPATSSFTRQDPYHHTTPVVDHLEILAHTPLPTTIPVSGQDINSFRTGNQFIHVCGVLSSVLRDKTNAEWNWLILKSDSTKVLAAATEHDYPYDTLLNLLDAEVTIRGIVHQPGKWGMSRGHHVILYGTNGLETVRSAPDPFAAPAFAGAPLNHRQRATGQVLGTGLNKIFLQTNDGHFLPISPIPGTKLPALGEQVTASGFVEVTPFCLLMTSAVIRHGSVTQPFDATVRPVDLGSLFTTPTGERIVDTSCFGKVIRIRGRIANSTDGLRTDGKILLEYGGRSINADIRHLLKELPPDIMSDCVVDITGICLPEADSETGNMALPQFSGITLVPRTVSDIKVVQRPSWWTPLRLVYVIVILLLIIVAFVIWNRMLRILSERRGRELAEEQILSAKADLKVEERTRLAIELHDSISQTLTGVALQIDAAAKTSASNPSAAEKFLTTARTMLASCRQELRCCIWDLKSRSFDEKDMTEAVQKTLAPHIGSADLKIRFNVSRSLLSDSAAHDTLRIIRELAVNALRHGQARHLRVAGEYRDGFVRFSVCDDGTGFDPTDVPGPAEGHFGLQGIRERIKDRNGDLHVESAIGKGAKITVTLMADEKDEDEK